MTGAKYAKQTAEVLGGAAILGRNISNPEDLTSVIQSGIPELALITFISRLGDAQNENSSTFVLDLFERNPKTAGPDSSLTADAGRSLVRIAELFVSLRSHFDSDAQITNFLMSEHPALNNMLPIVTAMTESGLQAVVEIIGRGEHGLPA